MLNDLPPLPEPVDLLQAVWRGGCEFMRPVGSYYTADQMHAYAKAALGLQRSCYEQSESAQVAQAGWIPVSERLPEMNILDSWWQTAPLLIYEARFNSQRVATYEKVCDDGSPSWYSACSERWTLDDVTHWMPLPQPPKEQA